MLLSECEADNEPDVYIFGIHFWGDVRIKYNP